MNKIALRHLQVGVTYTVHHNTLRRGRRVIRIRPRLRYEGMGDRLDTYQFTGPRGGTHVFYEDALHAVTPSE